MTNQQSDAPVVGRWTKGPWSLKESERMTGGVWPDGSFEVVGGDQPIVVCSRNSLSATPWQAESVANAHLIAAAPELYEALQSRVRYCPICDSETDPCLECQDDLKLLAKAHNAPKELNGDLLND